MTSDCKPARQPNHGMRLWRGGGGAAAGSCALVITRFILFSLTVENCVTFSLVGPNLSLSNSSSSSSDLLLLN